MLTTYTIDELLDVYYKIARDQFQLSNIKISKTGVVGFLLYILGHIKKDSEYYYNYLYKEMFPLTAQEYQSLLLYASLFGYQPSFANPATYRGNIKIYLPKYDTGNLKERIIVLPKGTRFSINKTIWTLDAELTIYESPNQGLNYATFNTGSNIERVPITINESLIKPEDEYIELNLKYLKQYINNEISFTMPYYDYGIYYRFQLDLENNQYLSDVEVYVKLPNEVNYEKYELSFVKFGYSEGDKVVFISQTSTNEYVLEFGNGIIGKYIPQNSEILIKYKTTNGTLANFFNGSLILLDEFTVIETDFSNNSNSYTLAKDAVDGEIIEPITDGKNVETIEELRRNILNYIKTRYNLVKLDDYRSLFSSLYDYDFLLKKIDFVDNDLYIYGVIHNLYYNPYKTISLTIKEDIFNPASSNYIYNYQYVYQKQNKIPYPFPIDIYTTQVVNNSDQVYVNDVSVFVVGQEITFNNDIDNIYTVVSIDNVNSMIQVDKEISFLDANTPIQYVDYEKVDLISPFLYVKDSLYQTYRGYLIIDYPFFMDLEQVQQNARIPNILLKIYFNDSFTTMYFEIIPYDNNNLDQYTFQLTVSELDIYNQILDNTNDYTYSISVTDEVFEKIKDNITINLVVQDNSGSTIAKFIKESYKFIYDLSDSIILKRYNDISGDNYIVQIPFISKEEYDDDKERILDKLKTVLIDTNLSENRLPSVQHSFRFYNTLELKSTENYLEEDISKDFINLPLILKIYLILDREKISLNQISVSDFIDQLKLDLAKFLSDNYTTDKLEYYVSKIEDFVHNYEYVKYVKVLSPDYNIIVKDFHDYLISIKDDKLKVASFCPVYFWWDVNNIEVVYDIQ